MKNTRRNRQRLLCAALIATATLAGCIMASVPVINPEIVTPLKWGEPAEGTGTLRIKHDKNGLSPLCKAKITVGRELVGRLDTQQAFDLHMQPGDHVIGYAPGCGNNGTYVAEAAVTIKAGETKTYRVGNDANGSPLIQPTAY